MLISDVYEPLVGGGHALLDTLMTYLEQGSSLEATARLLFVHPNTVRYRLRRVAELTDYTPSGRAGRLHPVGGHRPGQARPGGTGGRVGPP